MKMNVEKEFDKIIAYKLTKKQELDKKKQLSLDGLMKGVNNLCNLLDQLSIKIPYLKYEIEKNVKHILT
jgi:hypothetical protein